jgi:hypothetical protein
MRAKQKHGCTSGIGRSTTFLLTALFGGCAYTPPNAPPSVTLEIGGDQFPMNASAQSAPPPGGSLAAPPLNVPGATPGPLPIPGGDSGPPRSGPYAGAGTATNDPLGECSSPIKIKNWFVSGSSVQFGAFQGTIQPDGSLAMQARQTYITGRFSGSRFDGRVWQGIGVGCQYLISVQPLT